MSRQACNEKNCIAFIDKRENNFGGDVEPCDPGKQAQHFRPQLEEFLRRPVAPRDCSARLHGPFWAAA
jgi:hypothetical protein